MIKREIETICLELFRQYPVITITGPRQSGKTTLAKKLFPDKPYVNLEFPDQRLLAAQDPRAFLHAFPNGVILDEIQRVPELPSYIQGIVDEKQQNGMFVLTGSQQFEISQNISQSLAGRTAMIKLAPLSIGELHDWAELPDINTLMFNGFYPGLHTRKIAPYHFYSNYFETYIVRDLRQLSLIDNLMLFEKFVHILATRAASLLNYQSLANDCGVSQPTIKKWISLLEASYIIFVLPPFFSNIGKRLIKSPKIYFLDTGLLCFLLGIESVQHVASHPLRGAIFENCMVVELLKHRWNAAKRSNLFFFRDSAGNEVDVLAKDGGKLLPIEIKSAQTPSQEFIKSLRYIRKLYPDQINRGMVVYDGTIEQQLDGFEYVNWKNMTSRVGAGAVA
jgi:predicted AAA+ superfamily ATPase